jgi:hypothetical protein
MAARIVEQEQLRAMLTKVATLDVLLGDLREGGLSCSRACCLCTLRDLRDARRVFIHNTDPNT